MSCRITGLFSVLFLLILIPASAQLFNPATSLNVIKTEYFDIIFPSESESSARLLASYVDDVYENISALFDIKVPGRIPVTFTPHIERFNGYYSSAPSPHIVLYDTPMDAEWTNFDDNLRSLFLHELVHAVTLNTRSPFYRVLQKIFGNWVSPASVTSPGFMTEGATISMESLSGFGRANDPLIKQKLRQAAYEGKFHTPFQASKVYDYPGQGGNWYDYGGLFSTWLIKNYGIEKYAELWQAMGKIPGFSFFVYRSGYYRIFKKIYNIDFISAWNIFQSLFVLNDLEENELQYRNFSKNKNSISAVAAAGKNVYILDGTAGKINVYDTKTEKDRSFNTDTFIPSDLDVSSDDMFLLVSGYHVTGGRYSAVVTEHEAVSGRRTGRTFNDLYKARYFRDGVIGIHPHLHNTCIAYEDFNGNREILFSGNEELVFSGPQILDNERIVFTVIRKGLRELLLYNYASRELFRIESVSDDNLFWHYMRGLRVSEGKLFFSHNADDRMYKLGIIDLDSMQAFLSGRDFSGGVFYPVSADGVIYYAGAFFSGDGFMRFPESAGMISGTTIDIRLRKLDDINDNTLADDLKTEENTAGDLNTDRSYQELRPYFGLKYMNPFNLWLPLPLVRYSAEIDNLNFRLDGFGIFTIMADPAGRHTIDIFAYADITYRMAMIESLNWQYNFFGFPLTISFSDKVINDFINNPYRDTRVTLSGGISGYPGRWAYGLSLSAGYIRTAGFDGGKSAYEWKETGSAFFYSGAFYLSSFQRRKHELFGNGFSFNAKGISFTEKFLPRAEAIFQFSTETLVPVRLALYGAYDKTEMNLHGISHSYGKPVFEDSASAEYEIFKGHVFEWLAGSEISAGIFSLEIQKNLSHLYFNRFYGKLISRNLFYDSKDRQDTEGIKINDLRLAQSLVLKLGLVTSIIPVKTTALFIESNIWGAWKYSNTITGEGNPWGFGFGVNFNY
ncbi:MAG: hypothetical protein FWC19_08255 [Treponema sp.]|nr:hypothetical protein [Treponema sp.]